MRSRSRSRGWSQGSRSRSRGGRGTGGEVVWTTYFTPHGMPYYVQAETNQTTWERPCGPSDRVVSPAGMMPPAAAGSGAYVSPQPHSAGRGGCEREISWVKCLTHDGRPYYFSKELGQSVWQEPRGPNDRIVGDMGPPPPQMPHAGMPHPMMMMGHPMMPGMMLPSGPGAPPMAPPLSHEAIESFIVKSGLDSSARQLLQGLAPEVLRQVIDRGALTEARNPHAVLMARIRDAERGLENARSLQNGGFQHIPGIRLGELEAFISESRLDAIAAGKLRGLDPEVLRKVVERGSLTDARNPNAVLMRRIKDAEEELRNRRDHRRSPSNSRSPSRSRQRSFSPRRQGGGGAGGGGGGGDVEAFLVDNAIDSSAGDKLRRLPPHIQQRVLDRGSLRDARNPNAVLIGRIRDAEQEAGGGGGGGGGGGCGRGGGGGTGGRGPSGAGVESIEGFVASNGLDDTALEKLRALPQEILARVMSRGSLTDARNPNAVLMGRIRDAEQDLDRARRGGQPRGSAAVEAFIADNRLDESAAIKFRSISEDLQLAVMDRGNLADARNPNAMLMRRIKDAQEARR